ncbi:MAG: hypothetical protein WAM60_08710 [Candidatus Promineifilaceae bacterium]
MSQKLVPKFLIIGKLVGMSCQNEQAGVGDGGSADRHHMTTGLVEHGVKIGRTPKYPFPR